MLSFLPLRLESGQSGWRQSLCLLLRSASFEWSHHFNASLPIQFQVGICFFANHCRRGSQLLALNCKKTTKDALRSNKRNDYRQPDCPDSDRKSKKDNISKNQLSKNSFFPNVANSRTNRGTYRVSRKGRPIFKN